MTDGDKSVPPIGPNIMETTVKRYPEMGKKGWCFVGNVLREGPNGYDHGEITGVDEYKKPRINWWKKQYAHLNPTEFEVRHDLELTHKDPRICPVFARITNPVMLKEIGAE